MLLLFPLHNLNSQLLLIFSSLIIQHAATIGHLSLFDMAQLDDLWFEAMLNENETIENGIVVLVDMSG